MKWLILSDVHSNLPALQTVIDNAEEFDMAISLGDVVGYGPWPNECLELLRSLDAYCIGGNHEQALLNNSAELWANESAREALIWQSERITEENLSFISEQQTCAEHAIGLLMHGTPRSSQEYIDRQIAVEVFRDNSFSIGFFGHTHEPTVLTAPRDTKRSGVIKPRARPGQYPVSLEELEAACLCNPGSVGQPRDLDARASYAILDDENGCVSIHRVEYDIELVQRKMRSQDFPSFLIRRLSVGM